MWMTAEQSQLYDRHGAVLRARFQSLGVRAASGSTELTDVLLGDKIGHVSIASAPTLFSAYVVWAGMCSTCGDDGRMENCARDGGPDVPVIDYGGILGEGFSVRFIEVPCVLLVGSVL